MFPHISKSIKRKKKNEKTSSNGSFDLESNDACDFGEGLGPSKSTKKIKKKLKQTQRQSP